MTDQPMDHAEHAESAPLLVIAIDGPAGSGKSTIAQAVAEHVGVEYLDTGAMYRAVAHATLIAEIAPDDADAVGELTRTMDLDLAGGVVTVNGEDVTAAIRTPEVTRLVSAVAANPQVRDELRARQRTWATERGGGVMEGRDIGTVVFPDAALKVYLTASIEERARRRALQSGQEPAEVEADMRRRDTADSTRRHAPLAQADDAVVVDTTDLDITGVVAAIAAHVERVKRSGTTVIPEEPGS